MNLSALSIGSNLLGGLVQNIANSNIARENLRYQREANDSNLAMTREINDVNYQRQLAENNLTRLREDNAAQRAARDFELAGLSKTLAAGNTANASNLNSARADAYNKEALRNEMKYESVMRNLDIASVKASVQKMQNEAKLVNAQTENLSSETEYNKARIPNLVAQENLYNSQAKVQESQAKLNAIEGNKRSDYLQAQIDEAISRISLNEANQQKAVADKTYIIAQKEHVSKQTEKLMLDYAFEQFKYNIAKYDAHINFRLGLPLDSSNISDNYFNLYRTLGSKSDSQIFQHHAESFFDSDSYTPSYAYGSGGYGW